jgi:hypothetical protein
MFRDRGRFRERILSIAQKFREKGATSAERAMTSQELGLPPRFDEAMKRRLGRTGIFVDAGGGRYYLNEARLNEFQNRQQGMGMQPAQYNRRKASMITLRITRLVLGTLILALVLFNFFYERSTFLWFAILGLVILWFVITIFQIIFLANAWRRRRMRQAQDHSNDGFPSSQ